MNERTIKRLHVRAVHHIVEFSDGKYGYWEQDNAMIPGNPVFEQVVAVDYGNNEVGKRRTAPTNLNGILYVEGAHRPLKLGFRNPIAYSGLGPEHFLHKAVL